MNLRGPRNSTPCKREGCGQRFDAHAAALGQLVAPGVRLLCPDGAGTWTHENGTSATRPSTSFSESEIIAMADMLEGVEARADLRPFARARAGVLGILLGKAQRMKAWIAERRGGRS